MHSAMVRPYARVPKGQRIFADVPVNTRKNVTMLMTLSLIGIVEAMTVVGSSDFQVFATCLEKRCVPVLRPSQIAIMENISSYQGEDVQEAIPPSL